MPRAATATIAEPEATDDVGRLLNQVIRMHRVTHRLKQAKQGAEGGVDKSAHILLFVIAHRGPMRVADLASAGMVDASTVSRQAADLVREGLLRREADPEDGRASRMALTDAGIAHVDEMQVRRRQFFAEVVSDWSAKDVHTLSVLLSRFIDDIETRYGAETPSSQNDQGAST